MLLLLLQLRLLEHSVLIFCIFRCDSSSTSHNVSPNKMDTSYNDVIRVLGYVVMINVTDDLDVVFLI